jgi:hypothetical protein
MPLFFSRVSRGETSTRGPDVIPKSQTVFRVIDPVTESIRLSTCLTAPVGAATARSNTTATTLNARQRQRRRDCAVSIDE